MLSNIQFQQINPATSGCYVRHTHAHTLAHTHTHTGTIITFNCAQIQRALRIVDALVYMQFAVDSIFHNTLYTIFNYQYRVAE